MIRFADTDTFLDKNLPVLDVRSPSEYADGHIPGACSFPLFSDKERARIGTTYKQKNSLQAVLEGLEIVGPRMRQMAEDGLSHAVDNQIAVHCWRGGQRSGSVAWLLSKCGLDVTVLQGGYKSYRKSIHALFSELPFQLIVLGGRTGSRKTAVLHELSKMGEDEVKLLEMLLTKCQKYLEEL